MGPPTQMRRQLALVRRTPPCSERPNSFSRLFRKSHAAMDRSFAQHCGLVWSAQRKMCRRATGMPMVVAIFCWCLIDGCKRFSTLKVSTCSSFVSANDVGSCGGPGSDAYSRARCNSSTAVLPSATACQPAWGSSTALSCNPAWRRLCTVGVSRITRLTASLMASSSNRARRPR